MSSSDGYPAVASSLGTHSSQMLCGKQQSVLQQETYYLMTTNNDITSCPSANDCDWLVLSGGERFEMLKKTEGCLYNFVQDTGNIAVRVISHGL